MGRYSSDNYSRENRGGRDYSKNGYSMDDSRESMIEKLHEMLDDTPNEKIRNAIHSLINQLTRTNSSFLEGKSS